MEFLVEFEVTIPNASEYTFRTCARIETAAAQLDWLNRGVFVSVGWRQPSGVVCESCLVQ